MMESNPNPPLLHKYSELVGERCEVENEEMVMEECELPVIDVSGLRSDDEEERVGCVSAISRASSEWGFFQVVNHGISLELLRKMRREQAKLFSSPFHTKLTCGLFDNSYRWGNPAATSPNHFSWSEAFHVPLANISHHHHHQPSSYHQLLQFSSLREVMEEYASAMQELAALLAGVLVMNLGHQKRVLEEICDETTCFLRLNRYPPCPISTHIFGLVPHTDSDFLTILHQDEHVGGLQLTNGSKWVAVKPNQEALVVNIGDLFQAWSNDVYKSVEHKVMVNAKVERYSIAYFLCPSYESSIGSCKEPSIYRSFTFGEYRSQIQQEVKQTGHKVGLPGFLL